MLRIHAQAVIDRLNAVISSPNKVYNGMVPAGIDPRVNPYVLCRFAPMAGEREFDGVTDRFGVRIYTYSVGGGADAAQMVDDLVRAALQDVTLAVSGRSCWPVLAEDGAPEPTSNEATSAQVVTQTATYVLASIPG